MGDTSKTPGTFGNGQRKRNLFDGGDVEVHSMAGSHWNKMLTELRELRRIGLEVHNM